MQEAALCQETSSGTESVPSKETFSGTESGAAGSPSSVAGGGAVIGSHRLKITLAPGETKSLIFLLGYAENPSDEKWEAPDVINKTPALFAIYRLNTDAKIQVDFKPSYSRYYVNLGEISSYPPGYKENAGIFCHNNPWVSIAETRIGRGNRAFEIYKKTCPAYIEDISEIHRTEPYVYSQMIAGRDAPKHGEAKNSWLTGTAAWTFVNVSQYILGIRPDGKKREYHVSVTMG